MKFSYSWLTEHLKTNAHFEEIEKKLTSIGLEVEDIQDTGKAYKDFIVGQVLEEKKHPNADKLKLCKVDIGKEKVDVVCGAPNVEKGMKVVYAPVGSTIPVNQMKIKAAKIRGVESYGMMCSEYELGISNEHDGIIRLEEKETIGRSFSEIYGLNDIVIEIGITPNRQDCLGVKGIARDLASAGMGELLERKISREKGSFKSPIKIEIQDNKICSAFAGRYFRNVKNTESPEWLKNKLKSIGLRPISALVDITNFVMYDENRPLHVYDADKIDGKIIVRTANDGESFLALDEKDYHLKNGMCVIADEKKVLGLGGIMGGESTGCSTETKNVLLESALFDEINTAKTGRNLSILSDARYRFERGIDPNSTLKGIDLATQLILEICGGECSEVELAGNIKENKNEVSTSSSYISRRLGFEVSDKELISILSSLGIETSQTGDVIKCSIPSWRQDIHGEADISEEVIRIKGYENIPTSNIRLKSKINKNILNYAQKKLMKARHFIASIEYDELVTFSFTDSKNCEVFGDINNLKIVNPISEELDILRPNLLPNLLQAIKKNKNRNFDSFSIFEIGSQYRSTSPEDQLNVACGIKSGIKTEKSWKNMQTEFDIYDVKQDLTSLIDYLMPGNKKISVSNDCPSWYHPGRSGSIKINNSVIAGYFGELHPSVANQFKIKNKINIFELYLDELPNTEKKTTNKPVLNLSDFQIVTRDFAFVIDKKVKSEEVVTSAFKVDKELIRNVEIFDLFEDDSLGKDKKSIAIKVTLQSNEKTLAENDISEISSKIIESVEKSTSGTVRS